jgi:hypothetical protein
VVHRLRRVDRDERNRGLVCSGEARRTDRPLGVLAHVVREAEVDLEALAQVGERGRDLGLGCRCQLDAARHGRSVLSSHETSA